MNFSVFGQCWGDSRWVGILGWLFNTSVSPRQFFSILSAALAAPFDQVHIFACRISNHCCVGKVFSYNKLLPHHQLDDKFSEVTGVVSFLGNESLGSGIIVTIVFIFVFVVVLWFTIGTFAVELDVSMGHGRTPQKRRPETAKSRIQSEKSVAKIEGLLNLIENKKKKKPKRDF